MRGYLLTDEAMAPINRAIQNAKSPMGAYCVGIVCALAWQIDKVPPDTVLEAAAQCVDLNDAISWYTLTTLLRENNLVA